MSFPAFFLYVFSQLRQDVYRIRADGLPPYLASGSQELNDFMLRRGGFFKPSSMIYAERWFCIPIFNYQRVCMYIYIYIYIH